MTLDRNRPFGYRMEPFPKHNVEAGWSYEEAQEAAFALEELLQDHGISIEPGSHLETHVLSVMKLSEVGTKTYVSKAEDIRRAKDHSSGTPSKQVTTKQAEPKKSVPVPVETKKKITKSAPEIKTKTTKTAKKSTNEKPITKGWVVQIGTFSDPANAKKVRATLVRHGYHVRLEKVRLTKGDATRVRVGPFSDRGKAITTLGHIGRDAGLQGVVLRYP